ncbi:hypothetical protein IT414_02180 [bacterium]|nr:hypothetical protein [bacterium]
MSTTELKKVNLLEFFEKVINGPSREELFDSLRLFNLRQTLVEFTLEQKRLRGSMVKPTVIKARVMGIRPEDGSSNRWLVDLLVNQIVNSDTEPEDPYVSIYFDTQVRAGHIIVPPQREVVVRDGQIVLDGTVIGNLPAATFS